MHRIKDIALLPTIGYLSGYSLNKRRVKRSPVGRTKFMLPAVGSGNMEAQATRRSSFDELPDHSLRPII